MIEPEIEFNLHPQAPSIKINHPQIFLINFNSLSLMTLIDQHLNLMYFHLEMKISLSSPSFQCLYIFISISVHKSFPFQSLVSHSIVFYALILGYIIVITLKSHKNGWNIKKIFPLDWRFMLCCVMEEMRDLNLIKWISLKKQRQQKK